MINVFRVWKEGFDQRVGRKQDGFKYALLNKHILNKMFLLKLCFFVIFRHQKIEWDIETERMEEKKFLDDDKKLVLVSISL